jgi:hypothetical protein
VFPDNELGIGGDDDDEFVIYDVVYVSPTSSSVTQERECMV